MNRGESRELRLSCDKLLRVPSTRQGSCPATEPSAVLIDLVARKGSQPQLAFSVRVWPNWDVEGHIPFARESRTSQGKR